MDSDKLVANLQSICLQIGDKKILNNVSIDIQREKIHLVFGRSGSGKTSLLNILNTLYIPTSGNYYYGGKKINYADEDQLNEIKNNIGYFHQELALIEDLSLETNLKIIAEVKGIQFDEEKLNNYLRLLGAEDLYSTNLSVLSGGERQRCAFIKLLIFNYDLILIDEPTNNLDENNVQYMLEAIKELKKQGKTVVVVSHSKSLFEIADVVYDMESINEK